MPRKWPREAEPWSSARMVGFEELPRTFLHPVLSSSGGVMARSSGPALPEGRSGRRADPAPEEKEAGGDQHHPHDLDGRDRLTEHQGPHEDARHRGDVPDDVGPCRARGMVDPEVERVSESTRGKRRGRRATERRSPPGRAPMVRGTTAPIAPIKAPAIVNCTTRVQRPGCARTVRRKRTDPIANASMAPTTRTGPSRPSEPEPRSWGRTSTQTPPNPTTRPNEPHRPNRSVGKSQYPNTAVASGAEAVRTAARPPGVVSSPRYSNAP